MEDSAIKTTRIRRLKPQDVDQLLVIEKRCFRAHRFTRKNFTYHVEAPSSISAVAEIGGLVIGYVAGIKYGGRQRKTARLHSMAVLPRWRKGGIGSLLLKHFEREAAKRGARLATLEVRKTNRIAQALYRRRGYEVERVLPNYYAKGRDGLKMRKLLSPRS